MIAAEACAKALNVSGGKLWEAKSIAGITSSYGAASGRVRYTGLGPSRQNLDGIADSQNGEQLLHMVIGQGDASARPIPSAPVTVYADPAA